MKVLVRIRNSHAFRLVPGLELVERRVGLGEGLLDQVLGVGRVAGHPHRGRVELIQVGQHILLEPLAPLLESFFRYGTHPLGCICPRAPTVAGLGRRTHVPPGPNRTRPLRAGRPGADSCLQARPVQHGHPRLHSVGVRVFLPPAMPVGARSGEHSAVAGKTLSEGSRGRSHPVTPRPGHPGFAPVVARVARGRWSAGVGIGGQPPGGPCAGLARGLLAFPAGRGPGAAGGVAAGRQKAAGGHLRAGRERRGAGGGPRPHSDPGPRAGGGTGGGAAPRPGRPGPGGARSCR